MIWSTWLNTIHLTNPNQVRSVQKWTCQVLFGSLLTRHWRWMSGVGKSRWRLTKVVLNMVCSRWNYRSIGYYVVKHLFNKGGGMLLTSCGNSLSKEATLVPKIIYMMQCLFDQPLCKAPKWLSWIWVFKRRAFNGLFGANTTIWFFMFFNGPLRKHVKLFGTP